MAKKLRRLEINGGLVNDGPPWRLVLPPVASGYADAQIDDYGGKKRAQYLWRRLVRFLLLAPP